MTAQKTAARETIKSCVLISITEVSSAFTSWLTGAFDSVTSSNANELNQTSYHIQLVIVVIKIIFHL